MADQVFSLLKFSGSTSGRAILVAATATLGTTIHAAHATALDEVILFAYNGHTSDVVLTIEFGGVTVPDDLIVQTIPTKAGLVAVCLGGRVLTGGLAVTAFAGTTNVIAISGAVRRAT